MATLYDQWASEHGMAAPQVAQAPAAPEKKKGRGGFLTSIISELGGAGGAAGGAAAGAALGSVVPVIGTGIGGLIGAGLGGFLGGTGGRAAENKIRDDQDFFGEGGSAKSSFGEGALSGALSGLGEGFQVLKGAKEAKNLAKLGIDEVATQGAKVIPKEGMVQGLGRSLESGSGGYGIGAKVAGEPQLTAQGSKAVGDTLERLGIKAASPEAQAKQIGGTLSRLGDTLTKHYAEGVTNLSKEEMNNLTSNIMNKVLEHPDIDLGKSGESALLNKLQKLTNQGDTSKLWEFTKDISNKGINDNLMPDAKLVDREAVNRIFRDEIRSTLNNKVPGVAGTNDLYHEAKTAEKYLLSAAQDSGRSGGGIVSRLLNLSPVKSAEAKAGAALEKGGKVIAGNGGFLSQMTQQGIRQAPGNVFDAVTTPAPETQTPDMANLSSDLATDPGVTTASSTEPAPVESSPFAPENIESSVQKILAQGGKFKDVEQFLGIAESFQKLHSSGKKPLNSTAAQNVSDLENGIANIGQLGQNFKDSSANMPVFGNLLAKIPSNTNAKNLQASTALIKQIIGKALEGGVLRKEDEEKYAKILPTLNDTDEQAQYKVGVIANELKQKLALYKDALGNGDGGTDISQLLTASTQ